MTVKMLTTTLFSHCLKFFGEPLKYLLINALSYLLLSFPSTNCSFDLQQPCVASARLCVCALVRARLVCSRHVRHIALNMRCPATELFIYSTAVTSLPGPFIWDQV